jgi:hypothetical protein
MDKWCSEYHCKEHSHIPQWHYCKGTKFDMMYMHYHLNNISYSRG